MVNITFTGTERSGSHTTELRAYATEYNEILLGIKFEEVDMDICLDRDTAIKLVKELRKEIGELTK